MIIVLHRSSWLSLMSSLHGLSLSPSYQHPEAPDNCSGRHGHGLRGMDLDPMEISKHLQKDFETLGTTATHSNTLSQESDNRKLHGVFPTGFVSGSIIVMETLWSFPPAHSGMVIIMETLSSFPPCSSLGCRCVVDLCLHRSPCVSWASSLHGLSSSPSYHTLRYGSES